MKTLMVLPEGWPCKLGECPPGLFLYRDHLCFKSEYGDDDVFCDSGEIFWGGTATKAARIELIVQPCKYMWKDICH